MTTTSNRPDWHFLNDISLRMLGGGYLREGEEKGREAAIARFNTMIDYAEDILGFELPTLRYGTSRGWKSFASPVMANFGAGRALPISCNGSYMDDDMDSILFKIAEIGKMTQLGAGTSLYMGALRPFGAKISTGGTTDGPAHFARMVQEHIVGISQGSTRRGSCCVYLDVDHPDIYEWLNFRSTIEGVHHPIQHLDFAVGLTDEFMDSVENDPKGSPARLLMAKIINVRRATGRPFLFFKGNANRQKHRVLTEQEIEIYASNLCTEIMQPSGPNESFVCDLGSLNVEFYPEWKGTNFVREAVYFLDAVMTDYINKTEGILFMKDARAAAVKWRSLGLGVLGYHTLFQSLMIPFESKEARALNIEMHKYIAEESLEASRDLAKWFGEPEGMKGTGERNLTKNALAPTQSSSIIIGGGALSKSIEPLEAVVFENDNAELTFTQYSPHFRAVLQKYGKDTREVWNSIMVAGGSVSHLEFLTDLEREVFKPWIEIDPKEIVQQAIDRQVYLDQGQSLNTLVPTTFTMREDLELIMMMHKGGLKSAYYRNSVNPAQSLARKNATVECESCSA